MNTETMTDIDLVDEIASFADCKDLSPRSRDDIEALAVEVKARLERVQDLDADRSDALLAVIKCKAVIDWAAQQILDLYTRSNDDWLTVQTWEIYEALARRRADI